VGEVMVESAEVSPASEVGDSERSAGDEGWLLLPPPPPLADGDASRCRRSSPRTWWSADGSCRSDHHNMPWVNGDSDTVDIAPHLSPPLPVQTTKNIC